MIETFLTVMNAAQGLTKLYDWFTGVSIGDKLSIALAELDRTKQKVERLSDHIIYAPNMQQALSLGRSQYLENGREIVQLLDPLAAAAGGLLSTAVISSPEKLRKAFEKDPWEVLIDIRPLDRAKAPLNPDLAPIVFTDGGQAYVGWQTKGAMPQLFNCDFREEVGLWVPKDKEINSQDESKKNPDANEGRKKAIKRPKEINALFSPSPAAALPERDRNLEGVSNSGISSSLIPKTSSAIPSTPTAADKKEEVATFFEYDGVCVTNTRFIVDGQTFAMSNITSVKPLEQKPNRLYPGLLIAIGVFFAIIGAHIMLVLSLIGGVWWAMQKTVYHVMLHTVGGETSALKTSQKEYLQRVVTALNNAIDHRG